MEEVFEESFIQGIERELLRNKFIYQKAIKDVTDKLDKIAKRLHQQRKHRYVHQVYSRIKTADSIVDKLQRKGFPISVQSAWENLYDVAGIRVVCPFIEDVYTILDEIKAAYPDEVSYERDYINEPKPNGYRSIHLGLEMPEYITVRKDDYTDTVEQTRVKIEIQLRTIAMDFWASLEHSIYYKARGTIDMSTQVELKTCADIIADADARMQNISDRVNSDRGLIT